MARASQGEAEGSHAASRRKRPSQVALSEDEDSESGSAPRQGNPSNGKRRRSAAPQRNGNENGAPDEEEDDLTDLDEGVNGTGAGDGSEDADRAAAVADAAGSFKPEYQRGSDG